MCPFNTLPTCLLYFSQCTLAIMLIVMNVLLRKYLVHT